MAKLFEKKDPEDVKSIRVPVLFNAAEKAEALHLARIRNLPLGEYMRRAALGRRADVDYQTDIVLSLSNVAKSIRELRDSIAQTGHPPPDDALLLVMREAIDAMLRISK